MLAKALKWRIFKRERKKPAFIEAGHYLSQHDGGQKVIVNKAPCYM